MNTDQKKTPLRSLLDLAQQREDLERSITDTVLDARAAGASWQEIANHIGGTKQAAQQRYGKAVRSAAPETDDNQLAGQESISLDETPLFDPIFKPLFQTAQIPDMPNFDWDRRSLPGMPGTHMNSFWQDNGTHIARCTSCLGDTRSFDRPIDADLYVLEHNREQHGWGTAK